MEWWAGLTATDKAAWLSAIATAMATVTAIVSLIVAGYAVSVAGAANRWNRFDRRAQIHWLTHVYLRKVLSSGFKIDAPVTSDWWRDIWMHRCLFSADVRSFLERVFESGAALEHLKDEMDYADEEDADPEISKQWDFHRRRIASAVEELDGLFGPYLRFERK